MKLLSLIIISLFCWSAHAEADAILGNIRSNRILRCAANNDSTDYSKVDTHGNLVLLGADICKAVAVAILGNGARTDFMAYPDEQSAMTDLRAGKIDLFVGATPDPEMARAYHVAFGPPVFYEGQGFLAAKKANVRTLQDFAGKQICFIADTAIEDNLTEEMGHKLGIKYMPFPFEEQGEMEAALVTGHCTAITGDLSKLANTLILFRGRVKDFEIMPQLITKDPLAPVYRGGDTDLAAVVRQVETLLFEAEKNGMSQRHILMPGEDSPSSRLLATDAKIGGTLGLRPDWAANVIAAVGNYGEIYDRDVGFHSPYKLPRGQNLPLTEGGSIQPPPA